METVAPRTSPKNRPSKSCVVCGETSTRVKVNYDQPLCSGCRGFVKRVVQKQVAILPCRFGGICPTNLKNRRFCRSCRYQKCVKEGVNMERVHAYKLLSVTEKAAIAHGEAPIQYREVRTPPGQYSGHFVSESVPLFSSEPYSNFRQTCFPVSPPSAGSTPSYPSQAPTYLTPPYYRSSLPYPTPVYHSSCDYLGQSHLSSPATPPSSMDSFIGVFPALHKAIAPPFSTSTHLGSLPGKNNSPFSSPPTYYGSPVGLKSSNTPVYPFTPRSSFSDYSSASTSPPSSFSFKLDHPLANQRESSTGPSLPDHAGHNVRSEDMKSKFKDFNSSRYRVTPNVCPQTSHVEVSHVTGLSPPLTPQQSHSENSSDENDLFKPDNRKRSLGFNIDDLLFNDSTEHDVMNPSKKLKIDHCHFDLSTSRQLVESLPDDLLRLPPTM